MGFGIWDAGEYANWGPMCQAIQAGSISSGKAVIQ